MGLLGFLRRLVLTSPDHSATLRCTTYEEKTQQRWPTLCDDGTRAVSRYNTILGRWETTIPKAPDDVHGEDEPTYQAGRCALPLSGQRAMR
jgi:hypothetical protein